MNCKNCQALVDEKNHYCGQCGAKVVLQRISVKNLWTDFAQNIFGWDNKFFRTIRFLVLNPGVILSEYINGTRKKYMNPFAFLAIGMALSLFLFNTFSDSFYEISMESARSQSEFLSENIGGPYANPQMKESILSSQDKYTKFFLKFFNIMTFLMLPLYTLIAYLTYRRPYNYGEHLAINTFIQGLGFLSTCIFFLLSILISPSFYFLGPILLVFYYTYAYGKLYKLSIAESIMKLLKFIGILILFFIALMIFSVLIGILIALLQNLGQP